MNKKGFTMQILTVLTVIIFLGLLMVSFFIASLVLPAFTGYSTDIFNNFIIASGNETTNNLSVAATTAFTPAIDSLQVFQTLLIVAFIVFFIGFIAVCAMVRAYPWLIVVWIIGIILLAMVSIFLSITYTDIKTSSAENRALYGSWSMTDFLMSNLPMVVTILGILGALFMLIIVPKDTEVELGGFDAL